MDTLIQYIHTILVWILNFVDWVLIEMMAQISVAATALFAWVPVPSWIATASSSWQQLPPGVAYFAQALDPVYGFATIFSATLTRFCIRRVWFIN